MIQADTVLENLAREILMVDGEGKSLIPEYEIILGADSINRFRPMRIGGTSSSLERASQAY